MLVCFGGDGTILHAAKDANAHNVPILGVNLGSVGFMAELEQSELSMLVQAGGREISRSSPA
ncbi:MAG: NAD(+)/NADH kinase [Flavonifractor plautii]